MLDVLNDIREFCRGRDFWWWMTFIPIMRLAVSITDFAIDSAIFIVRGFLGAL